MNETPLEAVRVTKLFADILLNRLACDLSGDGDERIFQRYYGDQGSFLFWQNFLHGVVKFPNFVHHLAQARAEKLDRIDVTKAALQVAFLEAYQSDAPFFRGDLSELKSVAYARQIRKPETIKVLGKDAAEWLVSSPQWCHLVAPTLSAFLRGQRPNIGIDGGGGGAAKRGPKTDLTGRTAARMLTDLQSGRETATSLRGKKQDDLASHYGGVSRETAKKAMNMALSRFKAELNLDK